MRRDEFARQVVPLLDHVQRFATWLERSSEAADLVQESLAHALDRAGELRDETHLRSWLLRLVYRLHIDRVRREKRRSRLVVLEGGLDELEQFSVGNLDEELLARESLQGIEAALGRLTDEHRAVLVLV